MAEELSDSYPVREHGKNPMITRDVNEDRFLKISEENVLLKKHLRKQEDRIRQLATKLVRVLGEKSKRTARDDIFISDQKTQIEELEGQVSTLRSKLSVARQQLGSYTKLVPGSSTRQGRSKSSRSPSVTPTVVPDQVTRMLLDAKGENHLLRDQVKYLQDQWQRTNKELLEMKEQLQLKEVELHDEIIAARSQAQQETDLKQKKLAENIQFIIHQRDSKRTASWLATYEAQCRTLETSLNSAKENIGQLELQLSTVQEELQKEQAKSLKFLQQSEENAACAQHLKEANVQIVALKDENTILKDSNDTFLAKSLETCNRTKVVEQNETQLKSRIDQLESTVKNELKAKSDLIAAITQEKTKCLALDQALQLLDKKCAGLESQLECTVEELDKLKDTPTQVTSPLEVILQKEVVINPCDTCPTRNLENVELKEKMGQLKSEMSKVKELLKTQVGINKEYKEEIEALTVQLTNAETLHEKERRELMYIFSDKTHKMTELEQSLETLRQRLPLILQQTSSSTNSLHPLVDYESSKENIEIDEKFEEIEKPSVLEVPEPHSIPIDIESTVTQEIQDDSPKLKIHIQQFVPVNQDILGRLFVTWEHETIPRQYSSIVSDGVFESESVHLIDETFIPISLVVQLHHAVGNSDSCLIAVGKMSPGETKLAAMKSIENNEEIGTLFYSYTLQNYNPIERDPEPEPNNNEENAAGLPETHQLVPVAPVPIPRKFKITTGLAVAEEHKVMTEVRIPEQRTESSSESLISTKRKSILRRVPISNFPRTNKRRVRVSDKIEERKFDSVESEDEQVSESLESELGQVPEDNSRSVGQVLVQKIDSNSIGQVRVTKMGGIESDVSWKRRSRRISKQTATDESDEVSSSLSVGSEGETSKNISDIETISEKPGSVESVGEVTVEIFYARFTAHTRLLSNPQVKKFFIEYHFLNYPPEELETDTSHLKVPIGRKAQFNFRKTFSIDTKEKRSLLRDMVVTNKSLQFTLVTEPSDNDTIDCEDIGYAYVSLADILNSGNDITRKEIPLFDAENLQNEIGALSVSVLAFAALNAL